MHNIIPFLTLREYCDIVSIWISSFILCFMIQMFLKFHVVLCTITLYTQTTNHFQKAETKYLIASIRHIFDFYTLKGYKRMN